MLRKSIKIEYKRLSKVADSLRSSVLELFAGDRRGDVVLTPGILVALRVLLPSLGVRTLLMTDEEYYGPRHFAPGRVFRCRPNDIEKSARHEKPDAVLMSLVTWRGRPLNLRTTFNRLRDQRCLTKPLLIADYSHAGAIGFPSISELNADIVVGDFDKWVTPPGIGSNLAFLYVSERSLRPAILDVFCPFYLATPKTVDNAARWFAVCHLTDTYRWITRNSISRDHLLRRHAYNRALAEEIAWRSSLAKPRTCIVWSKHDEWFTGELAKEGLVWRTEDGVRALCRDLSCYR